MKVDVRTLWVLFQYPPRTIVPEDGLNQGTIIAFTHIEHIGILQFLATYSQIVGDINMG